MKIIAIFISIALPVFFCNAQNYTQQAVAAMQQKQPRLALQLLHKAEQEASNDVNVLLQLATTHFVMHNYLQAASYYEQALAHTPDHTNTRYNCATAYCKYGNFAKALEYYEMVYQTVKTNHTKGALFKMYIRCQQWDKASALQAPSLWWYTENICGKTVLLDIDKPGNGFGDGIQFIRYAQTLKQAGATVWIKSPKPLVPLLHRCTYIDRIFTKDDTIPSCDMTYTICIASLLLHTKDQIMMHKKQRPYLSANPTLIDFWHKQMHNDHNFKIGVCWQSSFVRDGFSGTVMPSPRSITLEEFAPLADTNITFYSLQNIDVLTDPPFAITQFTQDFDDSHGRFMDTAAVIMNMDLIITVDTSIAHLAGTLGKEVWLLLSCESDYRWFTDTNTSPLYPHMKLFRQKSYGDWQPVVTSVKRALQEHLHTGRTSG